MATENDTQSDALIAALLPKITESLLPALTEQMEKQIQGVVKKNDELLGKLTDLKPQTSADIRKLVEAAMPTPTLEPAPGKSDQLESFRTTAEPVRLSRSDARDTAIYKRAKAAAEERGVSLEIVADAT